MEFSNEAQCELRLKVKRSVLEFWTHEGTVAGELRLSKEYKEWSLIAMKVITADGNMTKPFNDAPVYNVRPM